MSTEQNPSNLVERSSTANLNLSSTGKKKEKIVILGGGVSALAAAFELTTPPDWKDKYDITLYQMGWRLGGKGATGRDLDNPLRVLEHGLHVWFGCYHNAFHLMWKVYNALQRPAGSPLATVQEAFDKQPFAVYYDYFNGQWVPWPIDFPTNSDFPGVPPDPNRPDEVPFFPTLWDDIEMIIELIWKHFKKSSVMHPGKSADQDVALNAPDSKPTWWERLVESIEGTVEMFADEVEAKFIEMALRFVQWLNDDIHTHSPDDHGIICDLLLRFKEWFWSKVKDKVETDINVRREWVIIDLGTSTVMGLLADRVLYTGLGSIDKYDLREWYKVHKASDISVWSGIVNAIYDSFFAYKDGDTGNRQKGERGKPDFAAGAALSLALLLFTYKGSMLFKMRAGTGDSIIAPIYQALMQRGVKFKFFHRVTAVKSAGKQVDTIEIARQVDLNMEEYNPLIMVKELPSWPSTPLYDQIVQGEELKAKGVDLESRWADWQDVGQVTLKAGVDFDKVILGIAVGALPYICRDLIEHNDDWKKAIAAIPTVQTQSVQLWFKPDLNDLGWKMPPPMLSGYADDLASWADFSQISPWENRPADLQAKTVFCASNAMKDDRPDIPPPSEHDYPEQETQRVYQHAVDFLSTESKALWPAVSSDSGQLDYNALIAAADLKGEDRLKAQYFRANIDPTERYDLSPSGDSNSLRLKPYATGYDNLYATGTWTYNFAYNIACMEVAVMSGMQVSRAICGYPKQIAGEDLK